MKRRLIIATFIAVFLAQVGCSLSSAGSAVVIPQSVYIDKNTIELRIGESIQLHFTALPEESYELFTWSTLSENIATVDESGNVVALAEGETKILISEPNGVSAACSVNVLSESFIDALNADEYIVFDGIVNSTDYGCTFSSPDEVRLEKAYYYKDNSDSLTGFLLYIRGENAFGGGALSYYGLVLMDNLKLLVPSGPYFDSSSIGTGYTLATKDQIDTDKINGALDEYWNS